MGLVSLGGVLTTADGWAKVDPTTLPLGHDATVVGYTDSVAATYGAGKLAASAAQAQPIRHLASFQRFTRAAGLSTLDAIAITGDTGLIGGANQETGHLFRKTSAGVWASVEFDSKDGDGADVAGSAPMADGLTHWVDSIVYAPGRAGGTFTGVASGTEVVQAAAESVFLWSSGGSDQVMCFPGETSGAYYTDFRSLATQIDDAAIAAAQQVGGIGVRPTYLTMTAATMASFNDQAWYGNVRQGSNYFPVRLTRSIIGNPFVVWPTLEIDDTLGATMNGVGAGDIDLVQLRTPLRRIMVNGDVLTAYSGDGVANIYRSVTATDTIYTPQYVTLNRGLLAPGAVCDLGGGINFAIMTDGWYLIASDGTFREVGVLQEDSLSRLFGGKAASSGLSGSVGGSQELLYKWRHDFYESLDGDFLYRLRCEYDVEHKQVVITVPRQSGKETWYYDIQNDRVWRDDWTAVGGRDESATAWGKINEQTNIDITWAADTGVWSTDDAVAWEATDAKFGESRLAHGDVGGYVYMHQTSLSTRDGTAVGWSITLAPHHYGLAHIWKLIDQLRLEYKNNENSIASATVQVDSEQGSESHMAHFDLQISGAMAVEHTHFRLQGTHFSIRLAGTGRLYLHSLEARFVVEGGDFRRPEGT
jgi:hypothetical protein